jgi:hypothetical protein
MCPSSFERVPIKFPMCSLWFFLLGRVGWSGGGWDFSFLDVFQWGSKGFPWSSQKVHWVLNVFINSFPIAPHFDPKWGLAQSCQFFHPCKRAKGEALYTFILKIFFLILRSLQSLSIFWVMGQSKWLIAKKKKNLRSTPSN